MSPADPGPPSGPVPERHHSDPGIQPARFRGLFLLGLVAGVSLLFFRMIRPFATALFLGAIFSGMAQPAYRRIFRRFGGRRSLASATTLLLFIVLLLIPLAVFLGIVANQAFGVSESVGPWVAQIQTRMDQPGGMDRLIDMLPFSETIRPFQEHIAERAGEVAGFVGRFVVSQLAALTRGTVTFVFLLFVMLYAMFFFLKDGESVLRRILYYLPLSSDDEERMLDKFVSVSRAMVKGTFLIGIIQGALAAIAFWIAGIPHVAFWGTVMAVLSIIPGIGAALVWVPAGIYLLSIGRTGAGIGVLLWCGILVSTVDNMLRPWLVGRDTRMPDLMILLGTLGGLVVFGAAGVIIGPIVAALFITVWELYGEAFRSVLPDVHREPPPTEPLGADGIPVDDGLPGREEERSGPEA